MKARWSEIVNAQAISEGIATRFTNLRNDQRGLPKPQTRYTPGRQALHKQGFFTDSDVLLSIQSWQDWRKRKAAQLHRMTLDIREGINRLLGDPRRASVNAGERQHIDRQLERCGQVLSYADKKADQATHAAMLRRMMLSGPIEVTTYYSGVEKALDAKPATPARIAKRLFAAEVCTAASAHLAEIGPTLVQLEEIEASAFKAMQEAHSALRAQLPKIESRVQAAVAEQALAPASITPARPMQVPAMSARSRQALAAHLASGRGMAG